MTANFDDALAQRALSTATPATLPLVKRSAYLADALRSMQSDTSNIRTPGALVSDLLADAILAHGSKQADAKLATAQQGDLASLLALHPGPGASAPAASPTPDQTPITSSPLPPVADARQSSPAGLADALSSPSTQSLTPYERMGISSGPQDILPLAQAVYGEARGESPVGQQATGSVILNRALKSGQPIGDVVAAPHQFEGYNAKSRSVTADSPELQPILQNLAGLLDGTAQDPTRGATNFYSPGAQAALGRPPPAWDNGTGQQIGNQTFFGGQPGAPQPPQGAPQVATNGPLPAGALPPQGGAPPPSGVMQPPPPNPAPGAPMAQPQGGPAPSAVPPTAGGAIPTGLPWQPGEIAQYNRFRSDPRTLPLAMELADKVNARMSTPLAAPEKMMWDPHTGRAVPLPGAETRQIQGASPSDAAQEDAFGNISHSTIPGVQGPVPEGMVRDPNTGGYVHAQTQQAQTFRIPGASGTYIMGPDGTPKKVADDEYGPAQLAELRNTVLKSDQYKDYDASNSAWKAMNDLYKQNPNGMRAYALLDTFARTINPGAVARVGTIQAIQEARGLPDSIRAWVSNLKGDGNVPPDMARNLIAAAQPFVQAHYQAVNTLNGSNSQYAQRHDVDPRDVTAPLEAPLSFDAGGVQGPGGNTSAPGSGSPGGNNAGPGMGGRPSPAAVEAELRRRGVIK